MKIEIYLMLFLGCLFHENCYAQNSSPITPLHEFMQANSDSTIVLEYTCNWLMGPGCPPIESKDGTIRDTNIYDGGGIKLYLITKDAIKILDYYAPDYYEETCPGRADRIAVLNIAKLFNLISTELARSRILALLG
jgi:hypothetical protein